MGVLIWADDAEKGLSEFSFDGDCFALLKDDDENILSWMKVIKVSAGGWHGDLKVWDLWVDQSKTDLFGLAGLGIIDCTVWWLRDCFFELMMI